MRQLTLFFLAALFFVAADCEREDSRGQLQLNFTSTYQDEPLVMYEGTYTYADDTPLKFQLFNFYLSDIRLIPEGRPDGADEFIGEVALIDFGNILTVQDAQQGVTVSFDQVPAGKYAGIRFGLGIAPELNATQPGDYTDPNHPLTKNWWSWARGYVFAKVEGNTDLDGDGAFTGKLTYHIGDNALYQELMFEQPLVVSETNPTSVGFNVDLYRVLVNGNDYLDFNQEELTQDHTNNEDIYGFLWDNLVDAVEIKQ